MAKKATAATSTTGKRGGKPAATQPRKTATQTKVDELKARLEPAGYVVVENGGKYSVKKGTRARKFIAEGLTVAGLETWTNDALNASEGESNPQATNEAIASEMASAPNMQIASVPTLVEEGDAAASEEASRAILHYADTPRGREFYLVDSQSDEIIEILSWDEVDPDQAKGAILRQVEDAITWERGKGKAPIDKKAEAVYTTYRNHQAFLIEAKYAPGTFAVYLGKTPIVSAIAGLEPAKVAAIQAIDKLVEAATSGKLDEAEAILKTSNDRTAEVLAKGKGKAQSTPVTEAEVSVDELPPSRRPNTDPGAAILMHTALHIPREYDFIGTAATPSTEVSAALAKLEPLQVKGELQMSILLDTLQRPTDTKRLELAMFLAQNGVEIKFLDGDRVELSTLAPPVSVSEASESSGDDVDQKNGIQAPSF